MSLCDVEASPLARCTSAAWRDVHTTERGLLLSVYLQPQRDYHVRHNGKRKETIEVEAVRNYVVHTEIHTNSVHKTPERSNNSLAGNGLQGH